ncbi:hypothetical protein [Adhaeribacter soli]|uniref:Uncharacterized protein n=1 Tax=Adhaeribacter soli TaxID=2607655 RepID=A0A5N1J1F3_9BACT|nr:hypothetical protein [Adhaeribacter soli]KAA9340578.1 hypothetical protein F0P94_03885 [Adhaeribacter soli]
MKNSLFFLTIVLVFSGCKKPEPKQEKAEKSKEKIEVQNPLTRLEKDFKFSHLTAFEIDTFNWETRPGNYVELDSQTFRLVWQDPKRKFIGQGNDRDYLYSWQTKTPDRIEFVILSQDESSYCDLLQYCIFDKNGKAIDNFIVASSCGDGGWSYESSGKLIAENKFEIKGTESESELIGLESNETIEGDSTITHLTIGENGKVMKEEISKVHFRKKL